MSERCGCNLLEIVCSCSKVDALKSFRGLNEQVLKVALFLARHGQDQGPHGVMYCTLHCLTTISTLQSSLGCLKGQKYWTVVMPAR